jgi:hypothetical protein
MACKLKVAVEVLSDQL